MLVCTGHNLTISYFHLIFHNLRFDALGALYYMVWPFELETCNLERHKSRINRVCMYVSSTQKDVK